MPASNTARQLPWAFVEAFVVATVLLLAPAAHAQWAGRDGWVEEPATKSLDVEGDPGHSYLDPASVHHGDDGLVYFNESIDVSRPDQIGKMGFMKDAYDCARDIKYMCVQPGVRRFDPKSTINTAKDPALPVYRKYLCSDKEGSDKEADSQQSNSRTQR